MFKQFIYMLLLSIGIVFILAELDTFNFVNFLVLKSIGFLLVITAYKNIEL